MVHFARLRPRLTRLTLPWVGLGLVSAAVSFFSTYKLATWQFYTLWGTAGIAVLFLWLLPSLKYSATFIDVTSNGLVIVRGFGSKRRLELPWTVIASVSASPIRGILIRTKEENEYVLKGYSSQRSIAAEMNSFISGK